MYSEHLMQEAKQKRQWLQKEKHFESCLERMRFSHSIVHALAS